MAAQNNTGMVITLACFVLLSVILGVFTWLTVSHNDQLQAQLNDKTKEATDAAAAYRDQDTQVQVLKTLIGRPGETDEVVAGMQTTMTTLAAAADGSAVQPNLDGALTKTATDRDVQAYSASDRLTQLNQKTQELQQTIERKDAEIKSHQDAAAKSEATLRQKETQHSEELASRQQQIDELREERNQLQAEYNTYKAQKSREIEDLLADISQKRNAIVVLRQKLFEQEDLSFDKADGAISFVDQNKLICFVDLGERDELQIGTTFSVYTKSNNGVGRRNTEDVKGKIEIVSIMGPHLAQARIVQQDLGRPIAALDPIYSPLFSSGQELQVAVAGMLDFDGNPGSDMDEFRRIVNQARAHISVQTNEVGDLIDEDRNALQPDDLKTRITEKTRFLIIGDTGESSDTQDPVKQAIYRKIQQNADRMKESALSNGVYVISLGSFLEYIGYSRKRLAWSPTEPFPGKLSNGAKSSSVNAGLGSRESSAAISGAFSSRKKVNATSTGHVSGLYAQ